MGYRADHRKANEEILGFDHPFLQRDIIDNRTALQLYAGRHQKVGHDQRAKDYCFALAGKNGEDEFDVHMIIDGFDGEYYEKDCKYFLAINMEVKDDVE